MTTVIVGRDVARRFTEGETRIEIEPGEAQTVRALVRLLDGRYPGIGPVLRTDMAVAIDGEIFQDAALQSIAGAGEVCFMPAIEAG